jgi:hypothetical protein
MNYGPGHRRVRAQWVSRVEAGRVLCARWGESINPGEEWDLDHVDGGEPGEYQGPSHSRCNRATNRGGVSLSWDPRSRIW